MLVGVFHHLSRLKRSDRRCIVLLFQSYDLIVYALLELLPVFSHCNRSGVHGCYKEAQPRPVERIQRLACPDTRKHPNKVVLDTSKRILDDQVPVTVRHLDGVSVGCSERLLRRFVFLLSAVSADAPDVRASTCWCARVTPRLQIAVRNDMLSFVLHVVTLIVAANEK